MARDYSIHKHCEASEEHLGWVATHPKYSQLVRDANKEKHLTWRSNWQRRINSLMLCSLTSPAEQSCWDLLQEAEAAKEAQT